MHNAQLGHLGGGESFAFVFCQPKYYFLTLSSMYVNSKMKW